MAVKAAYISKQGPDYLISPHFKLGEHRCPGVDKVLYSSELYAGLERLRAYGGFRITINSGYRSAAYNKKIHGATASKHIYGYAADIHVEKDGVNVSGKLICCLAQALGFPGMVQLRFKIFTLNLSLTAPGIILDCTQRGAGFICTNKAALMLSLRFL